ncbi:MAG: ABC-type transport system involved in multi-copper enzyme maturation permease subunit [Candidatus Paceibacteria bacterium]|jgi:ABC-type transport system involved in multi-copper enzyme maturation permease subunit
MSPMILRALFEDARQQVLDNKVFRLLIILTALPILFTFLVGFHEEGISIFWGWREIPYADILGSFRGTRGVQESDLSVAAIQVVQTVIVQVFVGMFGMMLSIAATAFFVPRILEKGSADTLFSKPVSRMAILLSRYFAGILFVAFLSLALVLGMYLGFLVNSGYNDPGFLWGALTLVYLYTMMHSFSVAVAVFTRSSTAAILTTIFLFMICGAVHGGWQSVQFFEEQSLVSQLRAATDEEEDEDAETEEENGGILEVLVTALNTAHYILPKTSDADMITQKLRRAITEKTPVISSGDSDFVLKLGPTDYQLVPGSEDGFEGDGVLWRPRGDSTGLTTISVRRYPRPVTERKVASKTRKRQSRSKDVFKALEEELEAGGFKPETETSSLSEVSTYILMWTDTDAGTDNRRYIFHFSDWMYEISMAFAIDSDEAEEQREWRREFLYHGNIVLGQIAGMRPDSWYEQVFDWDAELKYNIFFSIGSSLAFILSMLSLAWFRLRRIDF